MAKISYDAGLMAEAISYAKDAITATKSIENKVGTLYSDIPEDLSSINILNSIKGNVQNLSTRVNNLDFTLATIVSKISQIDSEFKSQMNSFGIVPGLFGITVNSDLKAKIAEHCNYIYNLSEDDYAYIKEHMHDILYSNYDLYGGRQIGPKVEYLNGDKRIRKIIQSYCPGITEEEIFDYVISIDRYGCGYVATANYIMEGYSDKPEQFEKDFGFPIAYKGDDGKIYSNIDYLVTDVYCYSQENNIVKDWDSVWDLRLGNVKFHMPTTYAYSGNSLRGSGTNTNERNLILSSDRYKNSNINLNVIREHVSNYEDKNISEYSNIINEALNNGNLVNLSATTYTMYLLDENNNRVENVPPYYEPDGSHTMTITGIKDNGNYIVSTWGEKYELDNDLLPALESGSGYTFGNYGLAIVEFGDDGNE